MFDVYLGGSPEKNWRNEFKAKISTDISICDSLEKTEQFVDCAVAAFYVDSKSTDASICLELGTLNGNGKQIIVCLDGRTKNIKQIENFCEQYGIPICASLDDLILTVEEFLGELELLNEK